MSRGNGNERRSYKQSAKSRRLISEKRKLIWELYRRRHGMELRMPEMSTWELEFRLGRIRDPEKEDCERLIRSCH